MKRRSIGRGVIAFIRRNSLFIAVGLCLALLGGVFAVTAGRDGRIPEAPAESSLDEQLSNAESPSPTERAPYSSHAPRGTKAPDKAYSPEPTVMPELTPGPSLSPAPRESAERKPWNPPVDGRLIRVFSMDGLIWSKTLGQWMTHSGVDIAAQKGSEVRAVAAGTVERVYDDDMMGTTVIIDHGGGIKTVSSGLKKEPPVAEGQSLEERALIGVIGDTAISECAEESHLHFEVLREGAPVDPEGFVVFRRIEG